jgi:hypothetical protein
LKIRVLDVLETNQPSDVIFHEKHTQRDQTYGRQHPPPQDFDASVSPVDGGSLRSASCDGSRRRLVGSSLSGRFRWLSSSWSITPSGLYRKQSVSQRCGPRWNGPVWPRQQRPARRRSVAR